MIPLLIIWLLKNYRNARKALFSRRAQRSGILMLSLLLVFFLPRAQERASCYNVLHNGEIKGTLMLYQLSEGRKLHIRIETEVKTRIIFRVIVKSIEEAVFENGILIWSSLYRQVNGEEKINQKLQSAGSSYRLISKDKILNQPVYPIYYSILSLYCQEPVNIKRVYSDSFHQYVEVKKAGNNKYQVTLPNGNSNFYYYENGVCSRVEVEQFYNIEFRLR